MAHRIQTREDLINYLLRGLGDPIVDQEITPSQLDDAIDDSIIEYIDVSGIGSTSRGLLLHEVVGDIVMPDNVKSVIDVFGGNKLMDDATSWNSACNKSMVMNSRFSLGTRTGTSSFNLLTLTIANQYFGMMGKKGSGLLIEMTIDKVLHITPAPKLGSKIAIDVVIEVDMDDPSYVQNHWIKQYALAKAKYQWGFTMIKFGAVTLASGFTIDYNQIMSEGKDEMDKLEEILRNRYTFPAMFAMG